MRSVDSGKRPLGRPSPCARWAPTVTVDVSRVVESVRDHEMPRQLVSKKDRADRQSILKSRGHTLTELETVQRDPTLYRKLLTNVTEDCHRHVLESFSAYLATLTPSQLALYPGSPKSAEDIIKPGGQIDSGHLHAWPLHKAMTAMNEDNTGHQQQGDRRQGSHLSHSVKGRQCRELGIDPAWARVAVLRQAGSPNEPTRANRIREDLARCCKLEGYKATIHPDDLRRMVVASGFDAGKSPDELKYAITHGFKTDMLGVYMSKSSHLDTASIIFGGEEKRDLLVALDQAKFEPDSQRPRTLCQAYRQKVFEDEEYVDFKDQQETLAAQLVLEHGALCRAPQQQHHRLWREGYNVFHRLYPHYEQLELEEYHEQCGTVALVAPTYVGTEVDRIDAPAEDGEAVGGSLDVAPEAYGYCDISMVGLFNHSREDEMLHYADRSSIPTTAPQAEAPAVPVLARLQLDTTTPLEALSAILFDSSATMAEAYQAMLECPESTYTNRAFFPGLTPTVDNSIIFGVIVFSFMAFDSQRCPDLPPISMRRRATQQMTPRVCRWPRATPEVYKCSRGPATPRFTVHRTRSDQAYIGVPPNNTPRYLAH